MASSQSPACHRLTLAVSLILATAAHADVRLPALISDNMVLLQEKPANVWGWADPQEAVSVTLKDKKVETVADAEGKWSVKLADLKAGEAGDMVIQGKNTLTVKNVAVGEVWVGSGQSNMEWIVRNSANPQEEAAAANYPQIRMFTVQKAPSHEPKDDCTGKWEVCTPETVPNFSAVAYFFGRELNKELKIPIGLIHSSWGGTPAEFWTPSEVLAADPKLEGMVKDWQKVREAYPQAKEAYDKKVAEWQAAADAAKAEGKPAPKKPSAPRGGDAFGGPACLYHGMIQPLLPYTISGAIWYQGESNASRAEQYETLFPTMIQSWRQRWNLGEFPFLFVQLANFMQRHEVPTDTDWARLRDAQLKTLALPHTGMAVAIDIGEANDIHPKNKQEVSRRLALCALATVYYQEREFSGPIYTGAQVEEGKIRLSFRHAQGLKPASGEKLTGFAIAGEDKKFVWAEAEIQGDHIVLQSPEVAKPVAARYAWADNPEANLVNEEGLPASPFRTDDWPKQ